MKSYKDWIIQKALPVWASTGFDAEGGRFRERLDLEGQPLPVPHRAMVQSRQIYVFAHAAQLGWLPEGGRLAEIAMRSLVRDYCERSRGRASFAFSIGADGRIVSPIRDTYAHAFVLFATAWLYRLNGDPGLLSLADDVVGFIETDLADRRYGGLFDQHPVADRSKRQNPHMHLLEAYLALDAAASDRGYLERARGLVELFKARKFRPALGVLPEFFAEDWSDHVDPALHRIVEPGHHFEWVWLLREYQRRTGEDVGEWIGRLYDFARRHGISERGLVYAEVAGDDGRVINASHRIWPHTEGLKAAVARHSMGDREALDMARTMLRGLMANFLDGPFEGGWIDHIGPAGEPPIDYVPASSLYHLFFAAAEMDRRFVLEDAP